MEEAEIFTVRCTSVKLKINILLVDDNNGHIKTLKRGGPRFEPCGTQRTFILMRNSGL